MSKSAKDSKDHERQVTEQYSMELMRFIKKEEDKYLARLADLYGCDELDVPVDLDILSLVSKSSAQRRSDVENLLHGAPIEAAKKNELIADLLRDLKV
jgi:phage portal protein BeeE